MQIRQGLKKFSNWPTYPQLYINGELVGGVDVCKVYICGAVRERRSVTIFFDRLIFLGIGRFG